MENLTPLQKKIITEWNKTIIVHPSMRTIAEAADCSVATVHKVISRLKQTNKLKQK